MSNIKSFSSKQDIHLQACEWISKIDRGLDNIEVEGFSTWINISEAHRQCLFDVAQTWDDLSILNQLTGLVTIEQMGNHKQSMPISRLSIGMAASFVLVCVCFLTLSLTGNRFDSVDESMLLTLDAETKVGEHRVLSLVDGSTIHLNTNSQVFINFTENQRDIQLIKGEAFFDVAHDVKRPFVVSSQEKSVTAVGTAFNVQLTDNDDFELLVTDGKVLVKNKQPFDNELSTTTNLLSRDVTTMTVGQKALVTSSDVRQIQLSENQSKQELAWRQGMLVFHGEPLEQALEEISRYTSVHFELADEKVKQRRVAGYFKANDVQGLLFALKNNFNIVYSEQENDTIVLSSGI
jgi:transmembrane sensor